MGIRTVLFDLDGTLIDTNELITASFKYTFKQFDLSFTREEILTFNGPPLRKTFEKINPQQAEAMIEVYREHNEINHDHYVDIYPYITETIEQLNKQQISMGIVTTKMREPALKALDKAALLPFFETVVALDDVSHAKPHPESVMKAMNQLKGKAESTIMIGDNSHDIEAGKNAGIRTAGVAWTGKGKDYLKTYEPHYMFKDMRDLLALI